MEVESHALSSFDVSSSSIPACSFRNHSEFRISDMSSTSEEEARGVAKVTDQMADNSGESDAAAAPPSPAAALTRCPSTIAAMKLQKFYRGYRTRRMLADSAVIAEELWWQALDFARLNRSTISFFNLERETAASRWNRVRLNASKVGKGLSEDAKAQKLAFQHWIEAIDPRHRYGHSLHFYYEEWCKTNAGQPFFYWLDIGDGKDADLKDCPRSELRNQCIKYLGPKEREHYEFVVVDGLILHKLTGQPLDTKGGPQGLKWIFVMSTSKKLYTGEKKKGLFHHSSFLAGGATLAAGRLIAEDGVLKCISAYSGHYKPTEDSLDSFLSYLKENGVNLDEVEIRKATDDYEMPKSGNSSLDAAISEVLSISNPVPWVLPVEEEDLSLETTGPSKTEYKRSLSGGLKSPKSEVPKKAILERINSKKTAKSNQLGHQLSRKWSTGAGPRIGCVADYPVELRLQAMELTNLSPRTSGLPPSLTPRSIGALVSPSNQGKEDVEALALQP